MGYRGQGGQPALWRLLGATPPTSFPAYASLLRYNDRATIAAAAERAIAQGYTDLKLHEIAQAPVAADREAAGPDARIMLDTNCPWSIDEAIAMALRFAPYDLTWLEEPVFPPEDWHGIARVRREGGIPITAGENAGGFHDFHTAFQSDALDIAQPTVAKIGGVTEMLAIADLAKAHGVRLIPHCAYFGPGFLASLHLHARLAPHEPFERLFVDLEASPFHEMVNAERGRVTVPHTPGLGGDLDPAIMARYAVSPPTVTRA